MKMSYPQWIHHLLLKMVRSKEASNIDVCVQGVLCFFSSALCLRATGSCLLGTCFVSPMLHLQCREEAVGFFLVILSFSPLHCPCRL